jgi:Tfp pilus assembly protein PilV
LSLVEVLIAVTILSIALLAFVAASVASRGAVDRGNYATLAAQAAGDMLADLQGQGYTYLVTNAGTTNYTVAGLPQGAMSVKIGPLDANVANTNVEQIDVTVTWNVGLVQRPGVTFNATTNKVADSYSISTLVSNR